MAPLLRVEEELATPGEGDAEDKNDEDDENEDLPALGVLISAANLDMQRQEENVQKMHQRSFTRKRNDKDQMLPLMQHLHIDVAKLRDARDGPESLVEDDVLLEVLKGPQNMVKFMFSKTTG